jgi:dihydropteroate synthase
MGILNVTPDSFFPGSRSNGLPAVVRTAEEMVEAGVDLIDVGGESTRPGSLPVAEEDEYARAIPAVQELRRRFSVPISIDTRRSGIARAALDAGADIVNDISALRDDEELARVVAQYGAAVILMHIRGNPETMQNDVRYEDTVGEIIEELSARVEYAGSQGISAEKIMIDPGLGFGKRVDDNLRILRDISRLRKMGFPLVVGASRKGFIGAILKSGEVPRPVEYRLAGSLAVAAYAAMSGAHVVRVHDVAETVDVVRIISAISEVNRESIGELA